MALFVDLSLICDVSYLRFTVIKGGFTVIKGGRGGSVVVVSVSLHYIVLASRVCGPWGVFLCI